MTNSRPLAYQSWSPTGTLAHWDSPAGGVGPGFAASADPRGDSWSPGGPAHPGSIRATLNYFDLRPRYDDLNLRARFDDLERRVKAVLDVEVRAWAYAPRAVFDATGQELGEILKGVIPGLISAFVILAICEVGMPAAGFLLGGLLGAFAGGAGAVPGAILGGEIGGEIGTAAAAYIMSYLGLTFIGEKIVAPVLQAIKTEITAVETAWTSVDHPEIQDMLVDKAAHGIADAAALFFRALLQAIVATLMVRGAKAAQSLVPELVGRLRQSRLGEGFAEFIGTNWQRLISEPKLKDGGGAAGAEGGGGASGAPGRVREGPLTTARAAAADVSEKSMPDAVVANPQVVPFNTAVQTYYPPKDGFFGTAKPETLKSGYQFSRYGGFFNQEGNFQDFGNFVAPPDVPFEMRSAPPGTDVRPLTTYEVVRPITDVPTGPAAPWFNQLGLGTQHQLPMPIQYYIDSGQIKVINRILP